ncbi:hypothetical protein MmiHf6_00210 [Methanimicrococcus hongohii]|uniref:Putative endonuclease Z1 domain-containing protein n=1 Tax=Methanimicrococcus hongohii TaxID=3028295 RepID=A0AA96UY37_9EURY|nr:Z1 domain-containing protein [Methanimicrococcus sp. Hf6]WNY22736.1 hypothetical protein MmiHf6_00210 [Methanimicrococcus sp. Hf6]
MSQEELLENLIKTSIRTKYSTTIPTEEEVYEIANGLRVVCDITEEEFQNVIKSIHSSMGIRVEEGISVKNESTYSPWIKNRKAETDLYYWNRYVEYLQHDMQWNSRLISTLDKDTDAIMDFIGDPKDTEWQRRGLIFGDVQSGKTANYTAICNKAADYGFEVIILLTGTIESLRRQTQERLDAGFVGRSSQEALNKNIVTKVKGVGYYSKGEKRYPISFTSTSANGDFNKRTVTNLNLGISSAAEPVLLVIKKNKSVLENLYGWLEAFNTDENGKINVPLLLLDDEADNASINTKTDDITVINKSIRNLLNLFSKAAYVGITATPFANIFIDPKSDDEMVKEDLFPKDFIYLLNPPSNYIGPNQIFGDSEVLLEPIEIIDEDEMGETFRKKTKSMEVIEELPGSLKEAMTYFVLTNIIRNYRGQENKHKSMLVNVSHYTNIQNQVAILANEWLVNTQTDIRLYSKLPEALECKTISNFKEVFEKYQLDKHIEWRTVQEDLEKEVLAYDIKTINQKSQEKLDYGNYENGASIIAIGGNSLSRGLTLEGLSVSYFYRSSKMYDTLMQMGRWFGYRDSYADLIKIWMTEDMKDWYSFVTDASNELKNEVILMNRHDLTPRHFGLQVRAHPDSLLVTARNKMRSTETIERSISVEGKVIETSYFSMNEAELSANKKNVGQFLENIKSHKTADKLLWKDVPSEQVIELLNKYLSHPLDIKFNREGLIEYIEKSSKLRYWDVSIPEGKEIKIKTAGVEHSPFVRDSERYRSNTLRVGKSRSRVRDITFTKAGLDENTVKEISSRFELENSGKRAPGEAYLIPDRKPLLMLYFINPVIKKESLDIQDTYYGMGLAFPSSNEPYDRSIEKNRKVRYVLNRRKLEEEGFLEYEEDDEDDDI